MRFEKKECWKMKKLKKKCFLLFGKGLLNKVLILVCFIGLMVGGSILVVKSSQEKDHVSAHPTKEITLDESGLNEFKLPVDATKLEEQAIENLSPQFDEYVQGKDIIPIAEKSNVTAYGSNDVNGKTITWYVNDVRKTHGGNYLVLFGASGTDRGGIIKLSLFNSNGEILATTKLGTLENNILRVLTGFLGNEGNSYLIGTSGSMFFKCTVENESNSTPSIELESLNTEAGSNGIPNSAEQLKIHETLQISGINTRTNDNKPLITGSIYPASNFLNKRGMIEGRIPIGALDNENWLNGNLTANVNHEYSLENVQIEEFGASSNRYERIVPYLYKTTHNNQDVIYGKICYDVIVGGDTILYETVQIFDHTDTSVANETLKKRKYYHLNSSSMGTKITILDKISDDENIYFLSNTENDTRLICVSLDDYQERVLQIFPADTNLLIIPNTDGTLSYYGSTTELMGEFFTPYYTSKLESNYYYIQGVMTGLAENLPASVISLRALELNNWLKPVQVIETDLNKFLIGGQMIDYQIFSDTTNLVGADGEETSGTPVNTGAFIGIIDIEDDYSPTIYGQQSMSLDINDTAITTPSATNYRNWNTLDRWLITGSKSGLVTDNNAIKVYDHFDSNDSSIGTTAQVREEWLQKRINRNPKAISTAIDWEKLGFDASKSGPQLVTYFVTDTQSQPSVTSRWVNKKTSQTIEEDDYLFDAQNFHIPLTGIESAIPEATKVEKFKELAKTMAWNTANQTTTSGDYGGGLDEDGASKDTSSNQNRLSNKVTVNETQLEALRAAKTAKPYPVDVTYKPENGVEIVNRVWVFVTAKNTLPNNEGIYPTVTPAQTNGVVYYADDYSLPFRLRGDHEEQDVLERGNVRIYDYYDASHETDNELPVLADKNTHPEKLQVESNGLATIQQVSRPGKIEFGLQSPKIPLIRYEWDGAVDANHQAGSSSPTYGGLDVTLAGDVLLHVRQVVLTPSDELVLPQDGYVKIENRKLEHGSPVIDPNYQGNITMNTQEQADSLQFTDIVVSVDHLSSDSDEVLLSLIVPEHYSYVGYYLSHGMWDSNGQSHNQGHQNPSPGLLAIDKGGIISEHENGEFFITFYIKPNEETAGTPKTPQPYSWSYKHNNLGEIKTK